MYDRRNNHWATRRKHAQDDNPGIQQNDVLQTVGSPFQREERYLARKLVDCDIRNIEVQSSRNGDLDDSLRIRDLVQLASPFDLDRDTPRRAIGRERHPVGMRRNHGLASC